MAARVLAVPAPDGPGEVPGRPAALLEQ